MIDFVFQFFAVIGIGTMLAVLAYQFIEAL